MFYGAFIFKFFGACTIWIINNILSLIIGSLKKKTFKKILKGKISDDFGNNASYEFKLIIIGAFSIFMIIFLILNWAWVM